MILSAHLYAAYLNVTKARIRAGAHIILSEDVPVPTYNSPILIIAQIIRNVMSSASESEMAGIFICAKEWSLSGKFSMKWAGHSQNHPFSVTTQLP